MSTDVSPNKIQKLIEWGKTERHFKNEVLKNYNYLITLLTSHYGVNIKIDTIFMNNLQEKTEESYKTAKALFPEEFKKRTRSTLTEKEDKAILIGKIDNLEKEIASLKEKVKYYEARLII